METPQGEEICRALAAEMARHLQRPLIEFIHVPALSAHPLPGKEDDVKGGNTSEFVALKLLQDETVGVLTPLELMYDITSPMPLTNPSLVTFLTGSPSSEPATPRPGVSTGISSPVPLLHSPPDLLGVPSPPSAPHSDHSPLLTPSPLPTRTFLLSFSTPGTWSCGSMPLLRARRRLPLHLPQWRHLVLFRSWR